MGVYLVRRTALLLVTVFGVSVIIFALMRIVPGNIADILFDSSGYIDAVEKAKIEAELGLDKSLVQQYTGWIGGLWVQQPGDAADGAWLATRAATWLHGHAADCSHPQGQVRLPLRATDLIEAMARALR